MHQQKIILISYLIIPMAYCDNQPSQTASNAKLSQVQAPTQITLDNSQTVDQRVIVTHPKKDPTDCTQLQGKEFFDCMACQSSENLKKNLMNCNDRMARYYFLNLSLEDYQEVLQNFTEKEWQAFYASRQPESRENFPISKKIQRIMLKGIYMDAYYNFFQYIMQSPLDPDDLEKLISNYTAKRIHGSITPEAHCALLNKFMCMRNYIFTKSYR